MGYSYSGRDGHHMTSSDIQAVKVSWSRWDAKALTMRVSHPTVWIWTADDGTERTFDTKREATEARDAYYGAQVIEYLEVTTGKARQS